MFIQVLNGLTNHNYEQLVKNLFFLAQYALNFFVIFVAY